MTEIALEGGGVFVESWLKSGSDYEIFVFATLQPLLARETTRVYFCKYDTSTSHVVYHSGTPTQGSIIEEAWGIILDSANEQVFGAFDAYDYDIMDVTRKGVQIISYSTETSATVWHNGYDECDSTFSGFSHFGN